MKIRQRF